MLHVLYVLHVKYSVINFDAFVTDVLHHVRCPVVFRGEDMENTADSDLYISSSSYSIDISIQY